MNTRRLVDRLKQLEATGEPEGGYIEGHLPDQPPGVLLTDRPMPRCASEYHSGVMLPDGRVLGLLPGGRTHEVKPCPRCEAD